MMRARSDRHSRNAVDTIASRTGCNLLGEREMTDSISLIAVWYSSDSCNSLAGLLGLEQPRVLDGNNGLVGKGLYELNLYWSQGAHLAAPAPDYADDAFHRRQPAATQQSLTIPTVMRG